MNEYDYNNNENNSARERTSGTGTPAVQGNIFCIIMIIVYVGMGALLLFNYFGWTGDWAWTRYVVGVMLVIYGIWRAYRQIKGIDTSY
ncbi:MAG: hypothetical protein K2L99_05840 [Muribaculaceae bacterium]|nr:hypothetical protein [Muribaculaceae bacterium]